MDYERKEEYQYIPITPYYTGLEEQGIRVLENKTSDLPLKKLDWPRLPGYRTPRGGSDDNFRMELLKYTWKYQQLHIETPHRTYFDRPSFIATRLSHDELCFHGVFLTRMAGDVAVVPISHNIDYLMLFIDTSEAQQQYRAVRFNRGSTLIIDAFVPHSFPIPIMGQHETFQMEVYHRALDDHIIIPTQEPLCIQLSNINKTKIHSLKILPGGSTNPEPVLPPDFANKKLLIEHSSQFKRFSPYGDLIEHWDCHHEKAQPLQWPGTEASDFHNNLGSLEQEFRITWIPKASSSNQKLYFEGLHDSHHYMNDTDAGIEYSPEKDEYSIHLISTRPDGTYYIHALKPETTFIMAFALPNPENGEPIKETLKAFYFHGDEAIHLHAGVWHSLPILEYRPNGSAVFKEIVCETNAHVDINIPFECGHSLKFTI